MPVYGQGGIRFICDEVGRLEWQRGGLLWRCLPGLAASKKQEKEREVWKYFFHLAERLMPKLSWQINELFLSKKSLSSEKELPFSCACVEGKNYRVNRLCWLFAEKGGTLA